MKFGYPPEADIDDRLDEYGAELADENNDNYYGQFKQMVWRLLESAGFARVLSVYAASETTFNIVGGRYDYSGTVKTFTPGAAIDPTDNDTTYVWMKPDNTIGFGVDGGDWPGTAHIKLAEIDVDANGVITDIRDMRTVAFTISS